MKKTQKFLAGIFLLAVLLLGLMPVSTKAQALKAYRSLLQDHTAAYFRFLEVHRRDLPAEVSGPGPHKLVSFRC